MPEADTDTDRIIAYRKFARRYANAVGVGRKTMLGATLDRLWEEMTPEERERLNQTWKDPS